MKIKGFLKIIMMLALCMLFAGAGILQKTTVDEILDGIVSFEEKNEGVTDAESWLDSITPDGTGSSEWYAVALSRLYPSLDLSSYAAKLEAFALSSDIKNAVTRERIALTLVAVGRSDSEFVSSTARDAIGAQGVMSYVFGLHLLNNGIISDTYSKQDLIESLLSLRLPDNGWAVIGDVSDTDVTAMVVQALAPSKDEIPEVKEAIDKALALLSSLQLENGGFRGFGAENPESAAQVIGALSAAGRDFLSDPDFIKNGNTILDALIEYRLPDGAFSHVKEGSYNYTATQQVFYSLTAYKLMREGKRLFVFDDVTPIPSAVQAGNVQGVATGSTPTSIFHSYKTVVFLCIALLFVVTLVILKAVKRLNPKNFLFALFASVILVLITIFTNIETPENFYNGIQKEKTDPIGTVTMSIKCDKAIGLVKNDYIPSDGVILAETEFVIEKNDSVYDILTEAARMYGIHVDSKGSAASPHGMSYISGINYLYEFDLGDLSGWIYRVNGISPAVGCGEYKLSDGDKIEWIYTLELGHDIDQ